MIYISFIDPTTRKERTTQVVRCLTIGRSKDADMVIGGDSTISRLHTLVIPRSDGRLDVRDLASSTGTFVIERGVKKRLTDKEGRAVLIDGEIFFVGSLEINVYYKEVLGEPTIHPYDSVEEDEEITDEEAL